jgi:hypothetical protein
VTSRTDLHAEPISNLVVQITGRKQFTLIEAKYTQDLSPQIATDGRAYFYSTLFKGTYSNLTSNSDALHRWGHRPSRTPQHPNHELCHRADDVADGATDLAALRNTLTMNSVTALMASQMGPPT